MLGRQLFFLASIEPTAVAVGKLFYGVAVTVFAEASIEPTAVAVGKLWLDQA